MRFHNLGIYQRFVEIFPQFHLRGTNPGDRTRGFSKMLATLSKNYTRFPSQEPVTFIVQPLECQTSPHAQFTACIYQRITCTSELVYLVFAVFRRGILLNWQLWGSMLLWVWILMVCHTAHLDTSVLNSTGQMCNYQVLWPEADVCETLTLTWKQDSVTELQKGTVDVRSIVVSYVMSVCPLVRMDSTPSPPPHRTQFYEILYLRVFFENLSQKIQFWLKVKEGDSWCQKYCC